MSFDPSIHTLKNNNSTQTSQRSYYKSIRNKKSQIQARSVFLTWGKERHGLRAYYIVTNTHPLGYPRRCETFQNMLFLSVQHGFTNLGVVGQALTRWENY